MVAIDLGSIDKHIQILDNGVNSWQTLNQQKEVLDDDPSRGSGRLGVTERLCVGCLHVNLEAFRRWAAFELDEAQSVVDLYFELLRETVVGHTDECAANFYDLTFAQIGRKVKDVLKAVGSISSHLNVTLHDSGLSDFNQALYSCWII